MNNVLFSINNLNFHYGKKCDSWSLYIDKMSIYTGFVAILGNSGCGKSTLISILSGLEKVLSDQTMNIYYYDKYKKKISFGDETFNKVCKEQFGNVFQKCYESKPLSAFENVALPLYLNKYSDSAIKPYCQQLFNSIGLEKIKDYSANELSVGQLSRIGFLRGIAQTPYVLFADEPASSLDDENAKHIMEILKEWQKKTGGSVIMVTHHRSHAFNYADQIIVLKEFNSKDDKKKIAKVIFQECKKQDWNIPHINKLLESNNQSTTFPNSINNEKRNNFHYLKFLTKMSLKHIYSKADSSYAISIITFCAFFLLFLSAFTVNQALFWTSKIDAIKNNSSYLKSFSIRVNAPNVLDSELINTIESIDSQIVKQWLQGKIIDEIRFINNEGNNISKFYSIEKLLCSENQYSLKSVCQNNAIEILSIKKIMDAKKVYYINQGLRNYQRYIADTIKAGSLYSSDLKKIKHRVQEIIEFVNIYTDINKIPEKDKLANVFPYYESYPALVPEGGKINSTVSHKMRWVDYRSPIFKSAKYKLLTNQNFRFNSNDDTGVIVSQDTLIDLGYNKNEIIKSNTSFDLHVDYGMRKGCLPVRAIAEVLPNNISLLTTLTFGKKISCKLAYCNHMKQYYRIHLILAKKQSFLKVWDNFKKHSKNIDHDKYEITYEQINNTNIELYYSDTNIIRAMTVSDWKNWILKHLSLESDDFNIRVNPYWEFLKNYTKPSFFEGNVQVNNINAVTALGYYLDLFYENSLGEYGNSIDIDAWDYKNKIIFAHQSKTIILCFKLGVGIILLCLFVLFLSTNLLIKIRNKISEIAIFRAMGGTFWEIFYIFTSQTVILVMLISGIPAFLLVAIISFLSEDFFIDTVINLLRMYDFKNEIFHAISTDNIWDHIILMGINNIELLTYCFLTILIIVYINILLIRYWPSYSISRILKER